MLHLIDALGCLHSYKKITWRSAPVFGTCLTSLPLLDAFGQKNRRMLAGIVCEFPRFWKWMWRNCKNKRGRLSHLNHELLKRDKRTDKFLHNVLKIAFLLGTNISILWGGKWLVMNPAWLDGACGRYRLWSSSLWADVNVDGVKISNIVWHKGRCFYDERVFRWIELNRCQDYTLV